MTSPACKTRRAWICERSPTERGTSTSRAFDIPSMVSVTCPSSSHSTKTCETRRTRFVCISDTHNCTVKLPKGDVLIHAGDLTNQGSYSELSKAVQWLEKTSFEAKIVIAGNHDLSLDPSYTPPSTAPPFSPDCLSLLTSSPSITYLSHTPTTINLTSPTGPHTTFKVFGSPYSPRQESGHWAFQYDRSSPTTLWDDIPLDTDVLITHTPAHTHCDEDARRRAMGCEELRKAMWRVRPRLHVCGHVHPARGSERVRWDLDSGRGNVRFAEAGVEGWFDDAVGGKMSLVDLTGRKGRVLDNDGGCSCIVGWDGIRTLWTEYRETDERGEDGGKGDCSYGLCPLKMSGDERYAEPDPERPRTPPADELSAVSPGAGTRGLGLSLDTDRSPARSDMEALRGRMGRRETCVVNCAIMATNWPHTGGRRFNKPIVVDIDLPVWSCDSEQEET